MIVGVPGEVKEGENRVALTPDGTRELTSHGHTVLVERGAGEGSAIHDREYRTAGAHGREAEGLLLDKGLDRRRVVDQIHRGRIMTLASNRGSLERSVAEADLVIGAVLVPGARAPQVVTEDMVRAMKKGAAIVDVAV